MDCDIIDHAFYSYHTVQSLLEVIDKLETQLKDSKDNGNLENGNELLIKNNSNYGINNADDKMNGNNSNINNINNNNQHHNNNNSANDNSTTNNNSHIPESVSDPSKSKILKKDLTIEDISTEVGSLTISTNNNDQGKYIGAATGSNFAKIFLKQMHLSNIDEINTDDLDDFKSFDNSVSKAYAPLPPYRIANYAIFKYINYVHIYYPIIQLHEIRNICNKMYIGPKNVSLQEKFLLFMVISIGIDRGEKDPELTNYNNQFKPVEYYNTAYRYLEQILSNRSERSLQAILLVIVWLLNTNVLKDDNGDLWHLARFSMSLAMELGVHRYNPDWNFSESKNELRNRLFWCTYILERTVAMKFGRGLSLRKQAIDTPLPKLLNDDYLAENSFNGDESLSIYENVKFKPSLLLIKMCEIYGDMLETVYISRTKGFKPILSIEEVINYKNELQISLDNWVINVEKEIPNDLDCYHELKVRYCLTSIILNRPSPSFPIPDIESNLRCKKYCQTAINSYYILLENGWKINSTCLHDLVNVGLTMIYCCWKTESNSRILKEFSNKTLYIMNEIIRFYPNFTKFKNLFIIVSSIVNEGFENSLNEQQRQQQRQRQQQLNQNNFDENDLMSRNVSNQLQQFKDSIQYPNNFNINNGNSNNVIEFNDWFTQELFQDVFKQYYFQNNDTIMGDVDNFFDYQNLQ